MSAPTALAGAALAMIGTPFVLHGRDPGRGLDCVGVVAAALRSIGLRVSLPCNYRLRRVEIAAFVAAAERVGLHEVAANPAPGDVLVLQPGPAQFHAGIVGPSGGLIHAHAGLRRVVLTPPPAPWPIARHWRLAAN